jgi:hypothetical protein
MDEMWASLVVLDHISEGRMLQALYDRAGDEPKRPIRRRLAAALRWLATRLAPLPEIPPVSLPPAPEVTTPLQPAQ